MSDTNYKYFFYDADEVKGPFSLDELLEQNITGESTVCYEGGDAWYFANQFPELNERLSQQSESEKLQTNPIADEKNDISESVVSKENIAILPEQGSPDEIEESDSEVDSSSKEPIDLPTCVNHPDEESLALCSKCLQDFCEDCLSKSGGKFYCQECKPKGFWAKLFKK